jgi:hypothetical protein
VWTGAENLALTGIRSPGRPACSESLYRLSYPGPYNVEGNSYYEEEDMISAKIGNLSARLGGVTFRTAIILTANRLFGVHRRWDYGDIQRT